MCLRGTGNFAKRFFNAQRLHPTQMRKENENELFDEK
jgi:hypothetical protein